MVSNQWSVISGQSSRGPATDNGPLTTDHRLLITDHRLLFYLLSLGFFALGLMSKPMLVTWPMVMLLLDYWPLGRMQKAECRMQNAEATNTQHATRNTFHFPLLLLVEKIPFFALVALMSVVTFVAQKNGGAVEAVGNLPVGARVGNALISYGRYLGKLFWPTDLAVIYPHPGRWPLRKVVLAGGLILGLSLPVFAQRRRHPYLLMGWLWFLGTLVPVIGLVQVGEQAMADRYSYLPSLGVLVLTIWGMYELAQGWHYQAVALSVAGGAANLLCLALTRQQIGYWRDSETLFRHALEVTENNQIAHNNLGNALVRKDQIDAAIRQYREAIHLKPGYFDAHRNLGNALDKQGQTDEAIHQLQEALRLKPEQADVLNNLGDALVRKGQIDEAIRQLREALRLRPNNAAAHNNLGNALDKKGQTDEAIRQFQEALRLKPEQADIHSNLGNALDKKGQIDEAIRQFQEALHLKPEHAEVHYNLALALGKKGQTDEAIHQFQEALRLKPDLAEAHSNLGTALGKKGQTDEAIRQFQEALRLKPDLAEAHSNLGTALYQQGQRGEAIQQFQEALRLRPDYADARRNLDAALSTKADTSPPPRASTNR